MGGSKGAQTPKEFLLGPSQLHHIERTTYYTGRWHHISCSIYVAPQTVSHKLFRMYAHQAYNRLYLLEAGIVRDPLRIAFTDDSV